MGGASGQLSWLSVRLTDLTVCEFEPCIGLCADSSEPGASFGLCLPLSLLLPHSCFVSLFLKNKH